MVFLVRIGSIRRKFWTSRNRSYVWFNFYSVGQVLFSSKMIRLRNGLLMEYLWGTISNSAPRGKHGTTRSKLELLPSEQKSSLVTNPNWTRSNPSKSLLLLSNSPPSIFIVIASRCDTANRLWLRDPQPKIVSITSPISNKIGYNRGFFDPVQTVEKASQPLTWRFEKCIGWFQTMLTLRIVFKKSSCTHFWLVSPLSRALSFHFHIYVLYRFSPMYGFYVIYFSKKSLGP